MNPLARLAAFALVLALLFGAGAAVGPFDDEPRPQPAPQHGDHP